MSDFPSRALLLSAAHANRHCLTDLNDHGDPVVARQGGRVRVAPSSGLVLHRGVSTLGSESNEHA